MANVLIIDDVDELRTMVRCVLEAAGHDVREAANGIQGLRAFRERPADLVICDIFMPEKEGLETILDLRREYGKLPIIAMSGGSARIPRDFLRDATALGASRLLRKPFEVQELLEAVNAVLQESPPAAD